MADNKSMILNNLFTRNTLRQLLDNEKARAYTSAAKNYVKDPCNKSNETVLKEIYNQLTLNYRNEYYYKNTLMRKILLGKHSVNTTSVLTELSIDKSKADLVFINNTANVFEIKTELDNFERLEGQLNNYYKAFNQVSVVTSPSNLRSLENKLSGINRPVGIYVLKRNGSLSTIRKPEIYDYDLAADVIFKVLRKPEFEFILKEVYGELPNVSQFKYYTECKKMIMHIEINVLYSLFLKVLRKRIKLDNALFLQAPDELKFLCYFMELKKDDYDNLNYFLIKSYGGN